MTHLFWLSDDAWAAIEPHLPQGKPGKPRVDDRRVISGILHVLKTGCRWRDCPSKYGPHTTIYNRYNRWSKAVFGSGSSRRWLRQERCLKSFASIPVMSKRTARRLAQKGGVRGSDWALARRKNEQNPCFGR
jgi:transposase